MQARTPPRKSQRVGLADFGIVDAQSGYIRFRCDLWPARKGRGDGGHGNALAPNAVRTEARRRGWVMGRSGRWRGNADRRRRGSHRDGSRLGRGGPAARFHHRLSLSHQRTEWRTFIVQLNAGNARRTKRGQIADAGRVLLCSPRYVGARRARRAIFGETGRGSGGRDGDSRRASRGVGIKAGLRRTCECGCSHVGLELQNGQRRRLQVCGRIEMSIERAKIRIGCRFPYILDKHFDAFLRAIDHSIKNYQIRCFAAHQGLALEARTRPPHDICRTRFLLYPVSQNDLVALQVTRQQRLVYPKRFRGYVEIDTLQE